LDAQHPLTDSDITLGHTPVAVFDSKNFCSNQMTLDYGLNPFKAKKTIAVVDNPMSCDALTVYDHADMDFVRQHPEACNIHIYDLAELEQRAS